MFTIIVVVVYRPNEKIENTPSKKDCFTTILKLISSLISLITGVLLEINPPIKLCCFKTIVTVQVLLDLVKKEPKTKKHDL